MSRRADLNRGPTPSLIPLFITHYKRTRLYIERIIYRFSSPCQSFGPR